MGLLKALGDTDSKVLGDPADTEDGSGAAQHRAPWAGEGASVTVGTSWADSCVSRTPMDFSPPPPVTMLAEAARDLEARGSSCPHTPS